MIAQRMADALAAEAMVSPTGSNADLVLNTCHIRKRPEDKVFSALGKLKEMKAKRLDEGRPLWLAWRAVAQAASRELMARASGVDLVIGPQAYSRLSRAVVRALAGERVLETDFAIKANWYRLARCWECVPRSVGLLTIREATTSLCTSAWFLYARLGILALQPASLPKPNGWWRPACANSRCWPERGIRIGEPQQRALAAGAAAGAAGGDSRHCAAALRRRPSARHGR